MKIGKLIEHLEQFDKELEADIISGSGYDAGAVEIENIEYSKSDNKVYIY